MTQHTRFYQLLLLLHSGYMYILYSLPLLYMYLHPVHVATSSTCRYTQYMYVVQHSTVHVYVATVVYVSVQ